MKIFFCDNRLGGLLGFRFDVIRHFVDMGHEVCLVAPRALTEWDRVGGQNTQGCRIIEVQMDPSGMNPLKDLALFCQYLRLFHKERPDMVFNYTIKPNIYSSIAARWCGCRAVCTMAGLGYIFEGKGMAKKMGLRLYQFGLRRAERVMVLNQQNYEVVRLARMVPEEKLLLLKGGEGVSLTDYPHTPVDYRKGIVFLMVARMLFDKGYKEFVEAAKKVGQECPEAHFALLGPVAFDSPMGVPQSMFERDREEGVFEYLGVSNEVSGIVGKPNVVVVLPSYHEGLNRSLMEACAIGRPIITTDIPGCRETVEDGKNGFLVPKADSKALAEAMLRFLSLPENTKREMAQWSHRMAKERFDVKQVIAIYDELVK